MNECVEDVNRVKDFDSYLNRIEDPQHRARMEEVFHWVLANFLTLKPRIAWNQPRFTDHGTFIIGFSAARRHLAVAPEKEGIDRFSDEIMKAGYNHTKQLLRIEWTKDVDYALLGKIINFNISEKANCKTFWRK